MVGGNADLDALDGTTRVRFVRKSLDDDASNAKIWTWGWASAGVASLTVNGIWAAASDYDGRVDRLGAASGGLMLAVTTLVDPMSVTRDAATVGTAVDASSPGRPATIRAPSSGTRRSISRAPRRTRAAASASLDTPSRSAE